MSLGFKLASGSAGILLKGFARRVVSRVIAYFKENWGAPFVLAFMVFLIIGAVSLSMGFAVWADEVAVYAYFSLVVGAVLQLVCFVKNGKREST